MNNLPKNFVDNEVNVTAFGELLLLFETIPKASQPVVANCLNQLVQLSMNFYNESLREIMAGEKIHNIGNNSTNQNEDVQEEVKQTLANALENVLKKVETQDLQLQSQQQQKPVSPVSCFSEKEVEMKKVEKKFEKETDVKTEKKEIKDENLHEEEFSKFCSWVLQQFSGWWNEDVFLPEQEVEEEEIGEHKTQLQTTPSVAELLIDDFFVETNVSTTSVNQPICSQASSVFYDPEFCKFFRQLGNSSWQPQSSQQKQNPGSFFLFSEHEVPKEVQKEVQTEVEKIVEKGKEEEDLAADISLASNLSFTTAPENDEEEKETDEGMFSDFKPQNSSSPLPPLTKVTNAQQQKMEDISPEDTTSAETVEPASTEDEEEEKNHTESETSQNEDKEENKEETSFVDERVIPSDGGDELFEPFELEDKIPFSAAATSGERIEYGAKEWEEVRDDPQLLSALNTISNGHNPDTIDLSTLDPSTSCIFCPSIAHCSAVCPVYRTMVDRIYRVLHDLGGCTVCLAMSHKKADCPVKEEIECPSCGLPHSEMLFHEPLKYDSDKEGSAS